MDFHTTTATLTDSTLSLHGIRGRASRMAAVTLVLLALLATTFAGLTAATATPAQASSSLSHEEIIMARAINGARRDAGLRPLRISSHLNRTAANWASQMDRRNRMYHNPRMKYQVRVKWARLAENVGTYDFGSSKTAATRRLHKAFMNSSGHRHNILGDHNAMGIGISTSGGVMWVTVNFAKLK
jgi:uncharacterized protein YkwD